MNPRFLGILGIALALLFWGVLLAIRIVVFQLDVGLGPVFVEFAAVLLGAAFFWRWILSRLEEQALAIRRHIRHLEALHSAALALTTEHDITKVLQQVVDLSRTILSAKYGALAVLDEEGEAIIQFITSGIAPEVAARIDHIPRGLGLLAVPLRQGKPVRVADIARDPRSHGFPDHHPPMHSLLGVPLVYKNQTLGILYLTDKRTMPEHVSSTVETQIIGEFSAEDTEVLEMFAMQAAIAIENARLYRRSQQVAVMQERERIGMDLHDGVIQSIFAIGLMLDDSRHRADQGPEFVRARLTKAIDGLNSVIGDIRAYIHDLRAHDVPRREFARALEQWVSSIRPHTETPIELDLAPEALRALGHEQSQELLHIAREAITNAYRHARASTITVVLRIAGDRIQLMVEDDGVGMDYASAEQGRGHGLKNIQDRTRALKGQHEYTSTPGDGTRLTVTFPK